MSESYKDKKGFKKIQMTCQQAASEGLKYAWVDTCCIDKSSSAELSEAINSMFRWYQRSVKCYVYLSDLPSGPSWRKEFTRCRWFTRGWTLQELLAPYHISFFDQNWRHLCEKSGCIQELSEITRIDKSVLEQRVPLLTVPVVQRMSWASSRQTTRIEDEAYCLMGIFGVNMPLLYGEEGKAFLRLQEEVIQATLDLTIFAWRHPKPERFLHSQGTFFSGFLADSPRSFRHHGPLVMPQLQSVTHISTLNKLIRLSASIIIQDLSDGHGERIILPVCSLGDRAWGIHMRRCREDGSFLRQDPYKLIPLDWNKERIFQYVEPQTLMPALSASEHEYWQSTSWDISQDALRIRRFHLCQVQASQSMTRRLQRPWPDLKWDGEIHSFFTESTSSYEGGTAAIMHFKAVIPRTQVTLFILGWDRLDHKTLQFTLVDMRQHMDGRQTDRFISNYQKYSHRFNSPALKGDLRSAGIPRKAAIVYHLADLNAYAWISATKALVKDESLCQNKFWRFRLSCRVCSWEDIPPIKEYQWE